MDHKQHPMSDCPGNTTSRIADLMESLEILGNQVEAHLKDEKKRRVYYQDIVYSTCLMLDAIHGRGLVEGIVCGDANNPCPDLKTELRALPTMVEQQAAEITRLRDLVARFVDAGWADDANGPEIDGERFFAAWESARKADRKVKEET